MCVSEYAGFLECLVCCVNFVLELACPRVSGRIVTLAAAGAVVSQRSDRGGAYNQPVGVLSFIAVDHRRSPEVSPLVGASSDWPAPTATSLVIKRAVWQRLLSQRTGSGESRRCLYHSSVPGEEL